MLSIFSKSQDNAARIYQNSEPIMDVRQFTSGDLEAWGVMQDFFGHVKKRFHIKLKGEWQGNKGILKEDFTFNDGKTRQREWTLLEIDKHHFTGTANDVVGTCKSVQMGNTFNSRYTLKLPLNGKTYTLQTDDWIYLVDEKRAMNIAKMKKFGVTVATVTLFFEKK